MKPGPRIKLTWDDFFTGLAVAMAQLFILFILLAVIVNLLIAARLYFGGM